jgi:GT2 family glycosyltransferase
MELSYCVVNTNGREFLLECLRSIRSTHPDGVESEVLVLDNASDDASAEAVEAEFPGARVIRRDRRAGLAENNSLIMREARGELCLLLNEDSELLPGAADELVAALERAPDAAAAGARLLSPAGAPQPSAWRFPGLRTALAGALFVHRPLTVQSRAERVREVDWVQSAGMLVRKAAFEQVGPLDPAFFVYSDEVDWQRRARDAGWSVLFVPGARIVHHEQLSSGAAARPRIVEFSRNRDLYVRKHHGGLQALAVRALSGWAYALRALAAALLPGRDARRYALHAYHSLFPGRGEGLREAAVSFNESRDGSRGESGAADDDVTDG